MYGSGAGIGMVVVHTQEKQPIRQVRPPGLTASYVVAAGNTTRLSVARLAAFCTPRASAVTTAACVSCGRLPRYNPILYRPAGIPSLHSCTSGSEAGNAKEGIRKVG